MTQGEQWVTNRLHHKGDPNRGRLVLSGQNDSKIPPGALRKMSNKSLSRDSKVFCTGKGAMCAERHKSP